MAPTRTSAVALLRGINVGNAKRIAMADLRDTVASLGYDNVRTVLQSGNVLFDVTGRLPASAAADIEAAVLGATGVASTVLVVPADEVLAAESENPLVEVASDPSRLLITFTAKPPSSVTGQPPAAADLAPERLVVGTHAVYQWCPDGVLKSQVPQSFWKPFGTVTARNAKTLAKITALLRET